MTKLEEIRQPIEAELSAYQDLFDKALSHSNAFLNQALSYIRGRKGKMMRPILVLLTAKGQGNINESTLMSAVTLELLHTASLVHDDVVDESSERRGQKSVNSVYDNKMAVLLGDYLLSESLHAAACTGHVKIVEIIAALGGHLAEGEIYQLGNTRREEISEEDYYHIIKFKTAALFRACTQLGFLSSTANPAHGEYEKKWRKAYEDRSRLGEIIGLIFQIRDDIFDYFDDPSIGKPRGNDMAEGKLTLPVIHAILSTGNAQMRDIALRVRQHTASPEEIHTLIAFTKVNGGIEYAEQEMQRLKQEALTLIEDFKDNDTKESLKKYLDFVINRSL